MANLVMVYGMRLLPADEVVSVGEAPVTLKKTTAKRATEVQTTAFLRRPPEKSRVGGALSEEADQR